MAKPQAKSTIWEFLQSLGKTFMLPVALLAFSGILLGVGSSLTSDAVKQSMPFLDNTVLQLLFLWMTKVGLVAFIYLPVMFAVAIPLGLAREEKGSRPLPVSSAMRRSTSPSTSTSPWPTSSVTRPRRRPTE